MITRSKIIEEALNDACDLLSAMRDAKGEQEFDYKSYFLRAAEETLKQQQYGCLTSAQKLSMREKLDRLQQATGHRYTHIEIHFTPIKWAGLNFTHYNGRVGLDVVDGAFLSWCDDRFEDGKCYSIAELMGGDDEQTEIF